jgi:ribosomal protein S21
MIKVTKKNGESGEKLLKRFSSHIKSRKLMQKFRELRYFSPKPKKKVIRQAAVSREAYRTEARKKQFIGG